MSWTQQRARLAALRRYRPADDPGVLEAVRDLAEARRLVKFEGNLAELVATAPLLTADQIERVRQLLQPSPVSAAGRLDAP